LGNLFALIEEVLDLRGLLTALFVPVGLLVEGQARILALHNQCNAGLVAISCNNSTSDSDLEDL